jgi:hypothetical protein
MPTEALYGSAFLRGGGLTGAAANQDIKIAHALAYSDLTDYQSMAQ